MLTLRKKYSVDIMLNDEGTNMSNGVRDAGLLGEERVTLEPYPGSGLIPNEIDPTSVLGKKGIGLDGNEVEGTILNYSNEIGDEKANVYLYPQFINPHEYKSFPLTFANLGPTLRH